MSRRPPSANVSDSNLGPRAPRTLPQLLQPVSFMNRIECHIHIIGEKRDATDYPGLKYILVMPISRLSRQDPGLITVAPPRLGIFQLQDKN